MSAQPSTSTDAFTIKPSSPPGNNRQKPVIAAPDTLTEREQWVCWRYELGADEMYTKVPYRTDGRKASTSDPATWTTFENAQAAYLRSAFDGIGFVFTVNDEFFGIDLDNCLEDTTGNLKAWGREIVERFADTYIEVSPSGLGLKIFSKGRLPRAVKTPYGDGHVEIYDRRRYFTVTGQKFNDTPLAVEENQANLNWLISLVSPEPSSKAPARVNGDLVKAGGRNNFLTSLGGSMRRHGMGREAIQADLTIENQKRCDPPLLVSEVQRISESVSRYPPAAKSHDQEPSIGYPNGHAASYAFDAPAKSSPDLLSTTDHANEDESEAPPNAAADKPNSHRRKKKGSRKGPDQRREFLKREDGIYVRRQNEETLAFEEVRICGPLEVLAYACNAYDENWSLVLRWKSPSGEVHSWVMALSQIALDERTILARLMEGGLWIAAGRANRSLVINYIQTAAIPKRELWECVVRTGWHGNSFVLPDEVIGTKDRHLVLQTATEQADHYHVRGTLDEWRDRVARFCVRNSRLIFSVSGGFAGPLLKLLECPCGGFHLVGLTSLGKTTALYVGGSVLGGGGPLHFCQSWKSTINGLEAIAALHNDTTLFLDELQSVESHQASECVYMLSAGIGKTRMARTAQGPRPRLEWRLLYFSSGELSLADHVASAATGRRLRGGGEVRLIGVPADAGKGLGLFEDIHTDISGCKSAHEFAQLLRKNTDECYGMPLRAWLKILSNDPAGIQQKAQAIRLAFVEEHRLEEVSGEVLRVLDLVACVAAAGELATEHGITGWPAGEAKRACAICFQDWLSWRGTHGSSDLEAAIHQVRLCCERFELSRFEVLGVTSEAKEHKPCIQDRLGYRTVGKSGETLRFFVSREAWKTVMCKGFDEQAVARELKRRKLLQSGSNRLQFSKKIKGKTQRVYALSGRILHARE